jgi:hypothetical protein
MMRRLAAGAIAGLLAGLAIHLLLVATGADHVIAARTPLEGTEGVAAANLASSVALGLAFAALPIPASPTRAAGVGMLLGFAVWLLLDLLAVRAWAGLVSDFDGDAGMGLAGRILWGVVLGAAYVALLRAMARTGAGRPLPT